MRKQHLKWRWLFIALLVLEIAALAVALRLIPHFNFANEAVLVVAVIGIAMVFVAKRLKKKPDCCG